MKAIIEKDDTDIGELYQDIFIQVGRTHLKQIIESDPIQTLVPNILLQLMGMGYKEDATIIQERIKARYQTSFWKEFIHYFNSFGSAEYKLEALKKFEEVFITLIDQIVKTLEVNPDDVFEQFNTVDSNDEIFDAYFNNKKNLGKIIRETAKLIGVE